MWDPPRPGPEPVSPALAGRFSTPAPPGKPRMSLFFLFLSWTLLAHIALPLVVLPGGFWSPVCLDELFTSLNFLNFDGMFGHIFCMLSEFIFSVEWFYLLLFLLFLSSFSWSVFMLALCEVILIYYSSLNEVSFFLAHLFGINSYGG